MRIAAFGTTVIPTLELAHSYRCQVSSLRTGDDDGREVGVRNVELMGLDAWLSFVGRAKKVADGPSKLPKLTPALVLILVDEFHPGFYSLDGMPRMEGCRIF